MRFRKENQIVTIAIENKGASTYQLRSWLHEFGPDGKQLDNAQVNMPPQIVGNSHQARLFGGQLFGVYHREGWQCTGDSHQPAARKQGAAVSSGGAAQSATSNGDAARAAAARPGAQASAGGAHGRGPVAPVAAGRGAPPPARGVAPAGAYQGNGPGGMRPAQPSKPKTAPHVPAHQPVASQHMMAGRGVPHVHGAMPPGAAAAGQARAMPHPGGMPGQQLHMQQGYRPPVGMHPAQQQQHHPHPHQVPAPHPAHAAHQAQGVPQYHAAAGRGYMPAHQPQVAGRGVAPGQSVARPPVSSVQPAGTAPPHQQVYKAHPGAAGVHGHGHGHAMAAHQQAQAPQQAMASGIPVGVAGAPMQHTPGVPAAPMQQQQHAGMAATVPPANRPAAVAKAPLLVHPPPSSGQVPGQVAGHVAGHVAGQVPGQVPGQAPPMHHATYQQHQQPPPKPN